MKWLMTTRKYTFYDRLPKPVSALLVAALVLTPIARGQATAAPQALTLAQQQQQQREQQLINRAEAAYKSGVDNYNANRLDAARLDFDFAVDTMLSSGMDLKNDPQLSEEFERPAFGYQLARNGRAQTRQWLFAQA